MNLLGTLLFFGPIAFAFIATASYVGTLLALKRYHEDDGPRLGDALGIKER